MKGKKRPLNVMAVGVLLFIMTGFATPGQAGVDVRIGVNLPALIFAGPPDVVVIPGTYVYFAPDVESDFFFFEGYWWRPYRGRWYRSHHYRGPWLFIEIGHVPHGLRRLPHDYRHRIGPKYERIHHRDVLRHWKRWEREKHWDKRKHRRHDKRDHERRRHHRD